MWSLLLGDLQMLSGLSPEQLALGGPAWAMGLGQMTSRGPFHPQLFCDSIRQHKDYKYSSNYCVPLFLLKSLFIFKIDLFEFLEF